MSEENLTVDDQITRALRNPRNVGELAGADAVGTAGSEDCGDMLRMWVKFTEKDGRKVIDRATFQSFGCETAIAVASVATDLIVGKTAEEALQMSGADLAAPLGALPPMKIHCSQMVEGALKQALGGGAAAAPASTPAPAKVPGLREQLLPADSGAPRRIRILEQ